MNIGSWHHQTSGDEKIKKEHLRRTRKLLEIKLNDRNLIKRIYTWAVHHERYSGLFVKWTREALKQMDQKTRKLMTTHKALHPRDDVDRLYVSRKEGGRGLTSIKESVDASIQRFEDNIEKGIGRLITVIRNNIDDTRINRTKITGKNGKENNCMDILGDKQGKSQTRKISCDW